MFFLREDEEAIIKKVLNNLKEKAKHQHNELDIFEKALK